MAVDSVILGLNNDLWMQILEFADPFSVANFACVSRRTRQICTTKLSCWSEAKNAATPRALRASLAKLGDLRELDLSHCRNVKDGVSAPAEHCPLLRVYNLRYAFSAKGGGVADVARRCLDLRCLDLSGIDGVGEDDFLTVAAMSHSLEVLRVPGCDGATDRGIEAILLRCPIRELNMRGCYAVRHRTFAASANSGTLEDLDASYCRAMGSDELWELACGQCPLKKLRIEGCLNVGERALMALLINQPEIRELNVNGCGTAVTFEVLRTMATSLTGLQSLELNLSEDLVEQRGLQHIASIQSLTTLALRFHGCVTEENLVPLRRLPNLKRLTLSSCRLGLREVRSALTIDDEMLSLSVEE